MPTDIPQIHGLDRHQVLTLAHCRGLKQYTSMVEGYLAGNCPFCDPLGELNVVVHQNGHWRMWQNPFPHAHTRIHLILAPVRHMGPDEPRTLEDFTSIAQLSFWAENHFGLQGGALVMRFGSPEYNAGSVLHLHANIIVPDGTGPVEATLAKTPEKTAAGLGRILIFEKLRMGALLESLPDEERELVKGRV